jgi:hypothetical protein
VDGKSRSGRKKDVPKAKISADAPNGDKQEIIELPTVWTFKSKYREDKVRLKPARKVMNADGSAYTIPAVLAEFSGNFWSTGDKELADILREKIKIREKKNPLGVFETTDLK